MITVESESLVDFQESSRGRVFCFRKWIRVITTLLAAHQKIQHIEFFLGRFVFRTISTSSLEATAPLFSERFSVITRKNHYAIIFIKF